MEDSIVKLTQQMFMAPVQDKGGIKFSVIAENSHDGENITVVGDVPAGDIGKVIGERGVRVTAMRTILKWASMNAKSRKYFIALTGGPYDPGRFKDATPIAPMAFEGIVSLMKRIVMALSRSPEKVKLELQEDANTVHMRFHVGDDLGYIIGKNGDTIRAIFNVFENCTVTDSRKYSATYIAADGKTSTLNR